MSEGRITAQLRRAVAKRAHDCCEYCRSQARFSMQPFSIEHILPRHRQGSTTLDNLALACQGCNGHKSIKTEGLIEQRGSSHARGDKRFARGGVQWLHTHRLPQSISTSVRCQQSL